MMLNMNYQRIYKQLIDRAINREYDLNVYYEKHHIIPRCLGGSDLATNLAKLTPEEHYVAHQLLTKMYPDNKGLALAASIMSTNRPSNKLYGWIRRRCSMLQSKHMLAGNSPTQDKRWISNESGAILVEKQIAHEQVLTGNYIMGKKAIRAPCGHLVSSRCKSCEDKKRKYLDSKKEETIKIANELFDQFIKSEYMSVCAFAKANNTSQPRLSSLWKKYVENYKLFRLHGKQFKTSLKQYNIL